MKKTNRSHVRQTGKSVRVFKSGANLGSARLRAIPFALAIAFGSTSSFADPAGAAVAAGQVSISAVSGVTTIHQISDRAVVNWQSFNVNAGEAVKFIQPSSTAAILNRVTGGSVSNINGLVEGNGRVYLINPNGIVVGANGVVNVNGGFVASTKSLADSAFMSGGALVFTGESTGSIQILGKVQSAQGDVILIAPKIAIEKTGSLIAGQTIKLVAANEVELSNGKFTVKPKAGDAGQLTIEGALEAAKVQLAANNNNLGALAINTTGTIRATGTQINPDGSVSIIATGDGGNIHISGNIRSEKGDGNGGAVTVLADNAIRVSGTIDANSTDAAKKGGDIIIGRDINTNKLAKSTDVSEATLLSNKGFVETSAHRLEVNGIVVKTGLWLLDPDNIEITDGVLTAGYTTQVSTSTITSALNGGTSITLDTATGSSGVGNILVTSAINATNTTNTDATLTLKANNGIKTNADIIGNTQAGRTGKINLSMTALGTAGNADSGIKITKDLKVSGSILLDGTSTGRTGVTGATGFGSVGLWIYGGGGPNGSQNILAGDNVTLIGTNTFTSPAPVTVGTTTTTLFDYGLCISSCVSPLNAGTTNISSSNGAVTITGNAQTSRGVSFGNNSSVLNTYNITANTDLKIQGTTQGKQAAAAYGVFNHSSGQLNLVSNTGNISIVGDASAGTLSTAGTAVEVRGGVDFKAANGGSTISGNARPAAGHSGVWIFSNTADNKLLNVSAGDLVISGTATGAANGIQIGTSSTNPSVTNPGLYTLKSNAGKITLTGTTASGLAVGFLGNSSVEAKTYIVNGTSSAGTGVQFSSTNTIVNNINVTDSYMIKGTSGGTGAGVLFAAGTLNITSPVSSSTLSKIEGSSVSSSGIQVGNSGSASTINAANSTLTLIGNSTNSAGISYFGISTTSAKTLNTTGTSTNNVGVYFQGNARPTFNTSAGDSVMTGTVTNSSSGLGVWADTGTIVTLNSGTATTSSLTLKTGASTKGGIRIGWAGNSTFNTTGNITIGSNDAVTSNNSSLMMQGTINATGKLTLKGKATGDGIFFQDGAGFGAQIIGSENTIITLDGISTNGSGISLSLNNNGWKRPHLISTSGVNGQINLKGVSTNLNGVYTGQAQLIGSNGSSVNIEGQGSRGVYIGATNSYLAGLNSANIPSIDAGSVKVVGTGANTGVEIDGVIQANGTGSTISGDAIKIEGVRNSITIGNGVFLKNKITNYSNGGATTIQSNNTNSNINFGSAAAAVTNESTAGAININATGGSTSTSAITSVAGATITQKANADVLLSTDGQGNLTPARIIKAGTGVGNVTIAAGRLLAAGVSTGGQILTNNSTTIANAGTGKIYLYSGKASSTGLLTNFGNFGLDALVVNGSATQNADTNVAYNANSLGISGSSAPAQIMFREKVAITNDLVGTNITKTYGDASTALSAASTLFTEVKTKLKQEPANSGFYNTTSNGTGTNNIKIAKSVVIDSLTGSLLNPNFSTSNYLRANATAYTYSLASTKYTNAGLAAGHTAGVNVNKLDVSVIAQHTSLNYTGALLTQNQPNHPFINLDKVVLSGLATGTAVGSYLSALRATGDDVSNYDIQFVDDSLVIAYSGANKAPTPPETYTRIAGDVVNLAPVSFAVGVTAVTAAGDEADPNICYAWGQRDGGSVIVHTLLKPSYLGLRHAKTDTQEAMGNGGASSAHSANPCGHDVATNLAQSNNI